MAQMVNLCGKIPADLHEKIRQEIEQTGSSTQKFVQQIVEEHFSKGGVSMEMRTLAVQVSEELFGRVKEVVAKRGCKQKDFLIAVIEQAVAEEEKRLGLAGDTEPKVTEGTEHQGQPSGEAHGEHPGSEAGELREEEGSLRAEEVEVIQGKAEEMDGEEPETGGAA